MKRIIFVKSTKDLVDELIDTEKVIDAEELFSDYKIGDLIDAQTLIVGFSQSTFIKQRKVKP